MARTEAPRKLAVGTGSSRDVGFFYMEGMAQAGWDFVGNYRNPDHRDEVDIAINGARVVRWKKTREGEPPWDPNEEKVIKLGGIADTYKVGVSAVEGDLLEQATADAILAQVLQLGKGIDALTLVAAGGYKRNIAGASAEEFAAQMAASREINIQAQLRLFQTLRPHMNPGSVLIYLTSDPAHRAHLLVPEGKDPIPVLGDYSTVAIPKNEAEQKWRDMIPELEADGIRVNIGVGNGLDGSFVTRALKRSNPKVTEEWLAQTPRGYFPILMEMSVGTVDMSRGNHPSGYTEYYGINEDNRLYRGSELIKR